MHGNYRGSLASAQSSNADVTERSHRSSVTFRPGEAEAFAERHSIGDMPDDGDM